MAKRNKVGGGSRKLGRNKHKCEIYRSQKTRERNKIRKIIKYIKRHPNDKQVKLRLVQIKELL